MNVRFAAALIPLAAAAGAWMALPASAARAADPADLSGRWVIDQGASDEPREVLDAAMRRRTGGPGRVRAGVSIFGIPVGDVVEAATGDRGGAPSGGEAPREDLHRHVTDAIDALDILQSPDTVRVDYDGIHTYIYRNGVELSDREATLHAGWRRGAYVVEREWPDRAQVTEAFRLDGDRLRWTVSTELESGKNVTIRRVYDRAPQP